MPNDPIHAAIERASEYYVTRALPDQEGEDKKESMSDLSTVISRHVLPVVEERERGLVEAVKHALGSGRWGHCSPNGACLEVGGDRERPPEKRCSHCRCIHAFRAYEEPSE